MEQQTWVFVLCALVGTVMISVACAVWWKHQEFGLGGVTLTTLGTLLLGISIWQTASIKATAEGFEFRIKGIERATAALSREVASGDAGKAPTTLVAEFNLAAHRAFSGMLVRTQQRPSNSPEYWPIRVRLVSENLADGSTITVNWDVGGAKQSDFIVRNFKSNDSNLAAEYKEGRTTNGIQLSIVRTGVLHLTMTENGDKINDREAVLVSE